MMGLRVAQAIARQVEQRGYCIFWSDLLGERVAFVKDASWGVGDIRGAIVYTIAELAILFPPGGEDIPPGGTTLRLIHQAKKAGGGTVLKGSAL